MGYERVVTYTTRPKRENEIDGIDYHFISKEEFMKMIGDNEFFESTYYQVANGDIWYYGTSKINLSKNSVIILNPDGVARIGELTEFNPKVFYLMADQKTLKQRHHDRNDNIDESERRIMADERDFANILDFTDFSIKNNGDFSAFFVAKIIDFANKMAIS